MNDTREGPDATLVGLDEFRRMPEEDGSRVELARGRLVREPRPGAEHGWLVGRLVLRLGTDARDRQLGHVVTETGFLLSEDPPTVRGPDAAFVSSRSLPGGEIPTGFWPLAPALAVEVLSPEDSAARIQEKVVDYLDAGSRQAWVVDPRLRTVTVWSPPRRARLFRAGDELDAGDALPGFRLEVSALFER